MCVCVVRMEGEGGRGMTTCSPTSSSSISASMALGRSAPFFSISEMSESAARYLQQGGGGTPP